jgi:hypothetical protein
MHEVEAVTGRVRQLATRKLLCLYARFFLNASIRIMATVCRFFPSQSVGKTSAGPGDPTLARDPERQTRLPKPSLVGDGARAPHLLKAVLSYIKQADSGQAQKLFALDLKAVGFVEAL